VAVGTIPFYVLESIQRKIQSGRHSLAVDLATHRLYAPEQEEQGAPVARMVVYEAVTQIGANHED